MDGERSTVLLQEELRSASTGYPQSYQGLTTGSEQAASIQGLVLGWVVRLVSAKPYSPTVVSDESISETEP